ncbi:glycosyltransferase [Chryseobacterium sp. S0630]|uniref:glycosyltransferase n=1 Tax=unclassified Chryseobacterium TaxID=2593645 RepID=UPI000553B825|nr:glycosyltransferase [Chryseobacterium sp. S0630]MCP1299703.1 glycosyltransferase [Chryseobacterium sp. S0630]
MNKKYEFHICHLTSVHPRNDSRIFHKMCKSLASNDIKVSLVVADGKGNEVIDNVEIIDIGAPDGRLKRITKTTYKIFNKAKELNADVFHLHDPELLLVANKLKKLNKKVIFDSHEDTVNTILVSPYLKSPFSNIISLLYENFERYICKKIDGVVGATPHIESYFKKFVKQTENINNYPILSDKKQESISWDEKKNEVCYVGSIDDTRGIKDLMNSLELTKSKAKLNLAGMYSSPALEKEIKEHRDYHLVNDFGYVNSEEVDNIYNRSLVGVVTLHPIPTFLVSLPIKMFEYMVAGIPFIASDFPYWRSLLKGSDCCIFVNPQKPQAIADAIDYFILNKERAKQMGELGQKLVYENFSWESQSEKLLTFYQKVLSN